MGWADSVVKKQSKLAKIPKGKERVEDKDESDESEEKKKSILPLPPEHKLTTLEKKQLDSFQEQITWIIHKKRIFRYS